MWKYKSLAGSPMDLAELTPTEELVFLGLMRLAGGPRLLTLGETNDYGDLPLRSLPSLSSFHSAREVELARQFAQDPDGVEHAKNGPLARALDDLEDRLEVAALSPEDARARVDEIRHDPRRFLWTIYRDCTSLSDFQNQTEIEKSVAWRILNRTGKQPHIGVDKLKEVAKKQSYAFAPTLLTRPQPPYLINSRDQRQQFFGQRLQALCYAIPEKFPHAEPPALLDRIFEIEFHARAGFDQRAIRMALQRARRYKGDVQKVSLSKQACIFFIDPAPASQLQYHWLFLALDYGWFESQGMTAAVLPMRAEDKKLGLQELTIAPLADVDADDPRASTAFLDLLFRPLFTASTSARVSADDDDATEKAIDAIRRSALLVLADPLCREPVRDTLGRWFRAFGWEDAVLNGEEWGDLARNATFEQISLCYPSEFNDVRANERAAYLDASAGRGTIAKKPRPDDGPQHRQGARRK